MRISLLANLGIFIGSSFILGGLSSCEQEQAPSREATEENGFQGRVQDRLIVRLPTNPPDDWELQSRIKGPRASTYRIPATDEDGRIRERPSGTTPSPPQAGLYRSQRMDRGSRQHRTPRKLHVER